MSDTLYRHIFENAPTGMAVHEPESADLMSVNTAYADTLGYDPPDLEGQSLTALVDGDDAALTAAVERALDGAAEQVSTALTGADGEPRQVTLTFRSIPDDGRRLLSAIEAVGGDDDAVKTASERRLEVALAGTDSGLWEWDLATDEVEWGESMEQLFALEPGSFEGTFEAFADRVHPDDLPAVESAIGSAVENGEMFQTEYRIQRDDGQQRWVEARGELHEEPDGSGRFVGLVTDITDRKRREQEVRQQQRQYRRLVERLPDAHYTIDPDWRLTFCNEALADRLGTTVEEATGRRIWDLVPEAEGTVVERTLRRVMETGEPDQFEYQYSSGDHWVSVQVYPYDDGVAAVSTDISDQRAELLSILDAVPVFIYRFDSDGVVEEVRGEVLERLGIDPDELIGESLFDVYADNEQIVEAAHRALDGESFRETMSLGDITFESHYRPIYEGGELTDVIGVSIDVTELHRQRERMEFFNSILRHDVLNGMTVIKMRAEILAAELEGEHAEYAQTILDWCTTTTEVTKRVRRVVETLAAAAEEHTLEPVDVSAILERKVTELERAYPEVTFETAVPDGVRVSADELLADVLGNLLTNGVEHNDTDGLRIETTASVDEESVVIRIADNGVGIDDDRKKSVFRRGETSHAKETGSGFGLFFVDVMIEKYGGEIRVEDSATGGAEFVVELSRVDPGERREQ